MNPFLSENSAVSQLLTHCTVFQKKSDAIFLRAQKYVQSIRSQEDSSIQAFMKEYALSDQEGIMLMCLAEALLRIPDDATANALIEDRLEMGAWEKHVGKSDSLFVNASTYALMLGAKTLQLPTFGGMVSRLGEGVIRRAIKHAIKLLGGQFVLAPTIEQALEKARDSEEKGYVFSYDMLGEGARTDAQALTFYHAYKHAIKTIAASKPRGEMMQLPSVSIKLSALHPKYELVHSALLKKELFPKLLDLVLLAAEHNISVSLDAEEQRRLDIHLQLYTQLLECGELKGYDGLGYVLQAYGKRALPLTQHLSELAKKHHCKLPVRLVKGAYWDSEIKFAQSNALPDYPVFTRKNHTDVSYLACANVLLQNHHYIYPQFATHNALSVASILETAPAHAAYEFQRLHGMGDSFYNPLAGELPIRVYAPVGSYAELLPYLIRRLLENGANSSFVNLVVDEKEPIGHLLTQPMDSLKEDNTSSLALPIHITTHDRAEGLCLGYADMLKEAEEMVAIKPYIEACSTVKAVEIKAVATPVYAPFDSKLVIGSVNETAQEIVETALATTYDYFPTWNKTDVSTRIHLVQQFAQDMERDKQAIVSLLMYEAGKTFDDAVFEWREAIEFCRFYAQSAAGTFAPHTLPSIVGEKNMLTREGKGVFACISPWNFPMSIFIGQVVAALLAGNTVIAKPAEQTSLSAYYLSKLLLQAGIPKRAFQLLLGKGETIGKQLTQDPRIAGVAFTGGTDTAKQILLSLVERDAALPTLIAETCGLNAMVVDSTALLEQACDDVVSGAFGTAGQRCSSLRLLLLQKEIAEDFLTLLEGAVNRLNVDSPLKLNTDVSCIIDAEAHSKLSAYIEDFSQKAKCIIKGEGETPFLAPHVFLLPDIRLITKEAFGPILHVCVYETSQLNDVLQHINRKGYGLTFGIHSRIASRADHFSHAIRAGNIYVNRGVTGAQVGFQPFGGMGLSGTGPKAGGDDYLRAFSIEKIVTTNTAALGGDIDLLMQKNHD